MHKTITGCIASIITLSSFTIAHTQLAPSQAQTPTPKPQTQNNQKGTQRVELFKGKLSFVPPAGFTPMTEEEIAIKFPRGNKPTHVYANKPGNVSIAITFSQANLKPEQLPQFKEFMESFLEKVFPEIKWIQRQLVDINKSRWVNLEMTSKAIDTTIHNDMYFTSFEGKMLGFNFNSTKAMYPSVGKALKKSKDSIEIKSN